MLSWLLDQYILLLDRPAATEGNEWSGSDLVGPFSYGSVWAVRTARTEDLRQLLPGYGLLPANTWKDVGPTRRSWCTSDYSKHFDYIGLLRGKHVNNFTVWNEDELFGITNSHHRPLGNFVELDFSAEVPQDAKTKSKLAKPRVTSKLKDAQTDSGVTLLDQALAKVDICSAKNLEEFQALARQAAAKVPQICHNSGHR